MAYEAFGSGKFNQGLRKKAAKKMSGNKKKGQLIDAVTNLAAMAATIKGGPDAGMVVKGLGGVAKGALTKDANTAAQGAMTAMKGKSQMKGVSDLIGALEGAESLEAAQGLIKSSGIDVSKLTGDDRSSIFNILGAFSK